MDMKEVFPTTGAIKVGVDDSYIFIEQHDPRGMESPERIAIPRHLLKEFLGGVFSQIDGWELAEIIRLCDMWDDIKKEDGRER